MAVTLQRIADCTALGTAARLHSALKQLFSTEQSNIDKRRLDRERCLSHSVASLGESWDREPGALSWRFNPLYIAVRTHSLTVY